MASEILATAWTWMHFVELVIDVSKTSSLYLF